MHDPLSVAFEIKNPFVRRPRDLAPGAWWYRPPVVTIWHRDPERRGDDDSCDWFGKYRRLNKREEALVHAWGELSHILGNEPFYPHPRLYGRDPHGEDNHSPKREMERAYYAWRRKGRLRWHPRWHIHHWHFQIHPVQDFKRWAFSRCASCRGRFAWGEAPVTGSWYGTGPRWFRGERDVRHLDCASPAGVSATEPR